MSKRTKFLSISLGLFLAASLLVVPGLAQTPQELPPVEKSAQELRELAGIRPVPADVAPSLAVQPKTYGTLDQTCVVIPASAFTPVDSSVTYSFFLWSWRYRTGGSSSWFGAPVHLPTGARVGRLELDYYDNNASLDVWAAFLRNHYTGGDAAEFFPPAGISSSGTPGYGFVSTDLTGSNIVIDNFLKQHWVLIDQRTTDSSTMFRGMIVCYKLQVSPAPGTATFLDVPTSHPFFQFVEALAKAGITSGCGGGNYCPDDPITRGQMAVFISRALGLHWPN